jgi:hypothetical protein
MQQIDAAMAFLSTNNEQASHTPDSHRPKNAENNTADQMISIREEALLQ